MTPEELNRTIEFIVQSQARLAVTQEQDKEWAKGLFAQLAAQDLRLMEMIEIGSRRLDEAERENRAAQKRHEDSEKRSEEFQKEALRLLHRILDRLTRNPSSKN